MCNQLSFLLGAGISIPASMPSTYDLTKQILTGENCIKHTDDIYYTVK